MARGRRGVRGICSVGGYFGFVRSVWGWARGMGMGSGVERKEGEESEGRGRRVFRGIRS